MLKLKHVIALFFLLFTGICYAEVIKNDLLEIHVDGVNKQISQNIFAHLGELPESNVQRRAFLFTVNDKVTSALQSLGYYHGKINQQLTKSNKATWQLTLTITSGKPTYIQWVDIQFSGAMQRDPAFSTWLAHVKLKPDEILNQGLYENEKSQLLALALSRGYFNAKYTKAQIVINRDLNTARINLHFDSGIRFKMGEVIYRGSTLRPKLLQQLVPFKIGQDYSTRYISELNEDLLATNYFSNIKVIPLLEKIKHNYVPIKVTLTPKPRNSINLGVGVDISSSIDNQFEPRFKVNWLTPQINRLGHSQNTSFEWSRDRPKFLTTYTIPLSNPLRDKLQIKIGLLRDKYGVTQVYDSRDRNFDTTDQLDSTKGLIEIIRQQQFNHNWLLAYSIQGIHETYTQSEISYDPNFVIFGISLQKTVKADNTLDPKWGFRQIYDIQYADPTAGSAARIVKLNSKYTWIHTFFNKHRIVTRLNLGINIVDDDDLAQIPPSLRFFAGGDQSIRGYGYQELGPTIEYINNDGLLERQVVGGRYLAVGSFEYQYYFLPTWRIAAFVDAGNAFDHGQFTPLISAGPGIHWISPVGPIKLDVGFGLNKSVLEERQWRIHLTMGSEL